MQDYDKNSVINHQICTFWAIPVTAPLTSHLYHTIIPHSARQGSSRDNKILAANLQQSCIRLLIVRLIRLNSALFLNSPTNRVAVDWMLKFYTSGGNKESLYDRSDTSLYLYVFNKDKPVGYTTKT